MEDQEFWESLSTDDQGKCFRHIMKLMHQAEVEDRSTYRQAMYDTFNLDYGDGLPYYMRLHNLICLALDDQSCRTDAKDVHNENTFD